MKGVRLGAIVLADDHRALALKLVLPKDWRLECGCEQRQRRHRAIGRHREIVVDLLLLRRAVEHRPELRRAIHERFRLRIYRIGLEEHVLVEVRQPLVRGRLRERAVLRIRFHGGEGHAVVLDHNYLESIW